MPEFASQGGCLLPGGVCSGGVLPGGGLLLGGVSAPGGGIPACTEADPPPVNRMNDRQVYKYYLGHNFVAAGNKLLSLNIILYSLC